MDELDDIIAGRIGLLDEAADTYAEDLLRVLDRLATAIVAIAGELDTTNGVLQRSSRNVSFVVGIWPRLLAALAEAGYDLAAKTYLDKYADVVDLVKTTYEVQGIKAAFTTVSREAAIAARSIDLEMFKVIGHTAMREVQRSIRQAVVYERDFSAFVEDLKPTITGTDVRGSALANRAKTFANTAIGQFDAIVTGVIGDEAGITLYKYSGPRDGITRPWCAARLAHNAPITRQAIEALPKSSSNVTGESNFIGRGGMNCRHLWVPAVDLDV